MIYRLQKAVNIIEDGLESFDAYTGLIAIVQGVPNIEGCQTKRMSDYLLERIANV